MNSKLTAIAATGLLIPGIVFAQTTNVSVYGKLNVDVETLSSPQSTNRNGHVNRVTSNSSLFGFRGEEKLGDGFAAFFQIESSVGMDVGTGTIAGRNTGVGFLGSFGTVVAGQWDTPYKNSTTQLDPFGDKTFAGYGGILYGDSSATAANTVSRNSFDRRQKNVVQYWTPPGWSGVSARLGYSPAEERGTCAVACSPDLRSASLGYDNGPFSIVGAYERHREYANTATDKTKDVAMKLAVSYTLWNTTLSAIAEKLSYQGNLAATGLPKTFVAGTASKVVLHNYWIGATHKLGLHTFRAAYGFSPHIVVEGGSAPDTKTRYAALGYGYAWSKRTELYVIAARIDNDVNSRTDFAINGLTNITNGANPTGVGIGVTHSF